MHTTLLSPHIAAHTTSHVHTTLPADHLLMYNRNPPRKEIFLWATMHASHWCARLDTRLCATLRAVLQCAHQTRNPLSVRTEVRTALNTHAPVHIRPFMCTMVRATPPSTHNYNCTHCCAILDASSNATKISSDALSAAEFQQTLYQTAPEHIQICTQQWRWNLETTSL